MYAGFRGSSKFVGPAAPSTQRRREESVAKSRSFGTFYRSKRVPLKHRAKQGKSFMLYLFNDSSCLMISRRLYLINLERRGETDSEGGYVPPSCPPCRLRGVDTCRGAGP